MTEEKKSRNPFINLANAAKAAASSGKIPASRSAQVQSAIKQKQAGVVPKPVKKAAGRGR